MNGLDLFSGYGGASESLTGFVKTIAYCEIEPGAQRVLLRRMQKGEIATAPIWDDVCSLQAEHLGTPIDIITAGSPCQNISPAGDHTGLDGEESRLLWEVTRLARDLRPKFLFLENHPNLLVEGYGFDRILGELASQGFDVEWGVLSAFDVGAPHIRERLWTLASNADENGLFGSQVSEAEERKQKRDSTWRGSSALFSLADAFESGLERRLESWRCWEKFALGGGGESWPSRVPEPTVRRLDDGAARKRAGTIRRISISSGGNGWVIPCAREAFKRLSGLGGLK